MEVVVITGASRGIDGSVTSSNWGARILTNEATLNHVAIKGAGAVSTGVGAKPVVRRVTRQLSEIYIQKRVDKHTG